MIENFIKNNNIEYYKDAKLKKYNTYRINATCKYLVFPNNTKELQELLQIIKKDKLKYIVLGNGSNIIFAKDYYDGVIIKLDKFNTITRKRNIINVGAGYSLIKLAMETAIAGLSGLEFAGGIPGSVGASTAMNAGAYNHSMSEIVESVEVITDTGEVKKMTAKELDFDYRDSFFKHHKDYIIISCRLKLAPSTTEEVVELITSRREKRQETQPLDYPSAGSVFRNPEGNHAGALIEKCGLKGYKIGGAMVSEKHANFIINYNNATGEDVVKLIELIKKEIKEKYKIDLIPEQIIID